MDTVDLHKKPVLLSGAAKVVWILTALLGVWAFPAHAAQNSGQFAVSINLLTGSLQPGTTPKTGFCRSYTGTSAFGATLTFVCTTVCTTGTIVDISPGEAATSWASTNGGAYRYVARISKAGEQLGTVESYSGIGTITSWRVVNLTNLDYLEMMVHW